MGYFNHVLSFSHSGVRAMSDQDKSKEQLIEELKDMCLKMAELEAVQKSLNKKESRYREIVDETSAAIFVIQDGWIKYANQKTSEIVGYAIEEVLASAAAIAACALSATPVVVSAAALPRSATAVPLMTSASWRWDVASEKTAA